MTDTVIQWLLEDNNPAVNYRTQRELLGMDTAATRDELLASDCVKSIMALFEVGKDFADAHAFSALTECGLTCNDIDIDRYVERHIAATGFKDGCGEGFLLRNLIALGYAEHSAVKAELSLFLATQQQSDGGFPCVSKNPKINKPNVSHKSCFQMSVKSYLPKERVGKPGKWVTFYALLAQKEGLTI